MNDNLTNSDRENQTDSELINNLLSNKITKWKEKLIDLTKRNRLLNFKSPKNASIKIIDEMPVEIFSILVSKSKKIVITHKYSFSLSTFSLCERKGVIHAIENYT